MAKDLPHLRHIEVLSNAYGEGILADLLEVTPRAIQTWTAAKPKTPRPETQRTVRELFERHQAGEDLRKSLGGDFKDKYIQSLERQNKILEDQLSSATGELRHIAVMNFAMLKTMRMNVAQILAKVEKQDLREIAGKIDKETAAFYRSVREKGSLIDLGI